ncbi:ArsD-related vicinal cysteine protein VcpD [Staphylospora marina]|uniref:ArsD-related vicinal cysteine protein VcpD n=1 Tax=Staphylospora marina TaxID=2490858 RepID=UPI000F5BDC68|nr:hypothetical protein [Staphylospora marina]
MEKQLLIEILPNISRSSEECCETDVEPGESCCESNDKGSDEKELISLKERLKQQLPDATIHLYNYSLPMDRWMARKKLGEILKERGFKHIGEDPDDSILSIVTPAIMLNGELISFGSNVDQIQIDVILENLV